MDPVAAGELGRSPNYTLSDRKGYGHPQEVTPYVEIYPVENDKIVRIEVFPQDTYKLCSYWAGN
jgi:hypothetical protein